eukprot:8706524-Lingulodinium_polyedra.AAC.1
MARWPIGRTCTRRPSNGPLIIDGTIARSVGALIGPASNTADSIIDTLTRPMAQPLIHQSNA